MFRQFYPRLTRYSVAPSLGIVIILGLGLGGDSSVLAETLTQADLPVTISGNAGGPQASDSCGSIASEPNLTVQLTEASYLDIQAQAGAASTLWIDGPMDFCVLPDANSQELDIAGHWPEGTYRVYVGDRQGQTAPYTLTVSQ